MKEEDVQVLLELDLSHPLFTDAQQREIDKDAT
jgi:hypothetical protein